MDKYIEPAPPLPPFSPETAIQKVRAAEDAWNTRDPERLALAYTLTPSGATALNLSRGAPRPSRSCGASGYMNSTIA